MPRLLLQTVVALILWQAAAVVHAGTAQSITFPEIGVHMTTDAPFALNATASSGLPVGYSIVSTGTVATLSGNTITLTGTPGSVTVKASQAGDGTHDAAEAVYRSFVVGDYAQRFVKVVSGPTANHSIGIRADGTLWAWGNNSSGQLGLNDAIDRASPTQVGVGSDWTSAACGEEHSVALRADGTLWSWGRNNEYQLGLGDTTIRIIPVQVGTSNNWLSVACGKSHTMAVRADGTLWAWGEGSYGRLGDGTSTDRISPVQVGIAGTWGSVACGESHTVAVRSDGTLWAWGRNQFGELGDGSTFSRYSPVQIGNATNWSFVACGDGHTIGIRSGGTLWAWGNNDKGQLGDGTKIQRTSPVQIGSATNWMSVAAGLYHTMAVRSDGTLWVWGSNGNGQLGQDPMNDQITPTQFGNDNTWIGGFCGSSHSLALRNDGVLHAWGSEGFSQLGYGNVIDSSRPALLSSGSTWRSVAGLGAGYSHTAAIRTDGTLWVWGSNTSGQLGHDTRNIRSQVGGDSNWALVSCGGSFTVAVRDDGTLWAWGYNNYGQLGDGSKSARSAPVQVGIGNSWTSVDCGGAHTAATRSDGTLWTWGDNSRGQLGDGSTISKSQPIQVGTATDWASVACGQSCTLAVKTDGTLWAWGDNFYGQLGDGSATSRVFPVQVGGDGNWRSISCGFSFTLGLRSDGTLWSWGTNTYGQLGDGSTTSRKSPQQVGSVSLWTSISCGEYHSVATRSDGTLWTWGRNNFGQLGNGSSVASAQPRQVGGFAFWVGTKCGSYHSMAIRSDGTLWTWGRNDGGQAGNPDTPTPVVTWPTRSEQSLTFPAIGILSPGQSLTIGAAASSGLPVTFGVEGPALLADNTVTATAAGIVTVTAYQDGDNAWTMAIPASQNQSVVAPEINISGNTKTIVSHDLTPSLTDHTDFGSVALLHSEVVRIFTISNSSTSPLHLTGTPKVQLSGSGASAFSVIREPESTVSATGTTTFGVKFDPTFPGLYSATISIPNDDPDETPYTFAIRGLGSLDAPQSQAITFDAPGTLFLSQSPITLTAYTSSGLPVTLIIVAGPATLASKTLTLTGAGTIKVQATQAGGSNYSAAVPVTRTITVKADPTTLALINLNQRYDGMSKAVGTMGTSDPVTITYKQGTNVVAAPINAGSYAVKAVAGAVTKTGTLVITKAPLFVKVEDKRKFAGQVNPALTRTITGFVNGETESVITKQPVLSTTAVTGSPGGLYPITSSGGSAANYTFIHQRGTMVVESFAGAYEALLVDATPLPVGRLNLTVTATSKSFTGKLHTSTETAALPISGTLTTDTLNEQATGAVTVTKNGIPYVTTFTLPLLGDVSANATRDGQPLGSATDGKKLGTSTVTHGGAYTMVLEPPTPAVGAPAGAGWAKATISSKGVISLNGKLNDGTPFTTTLSPDGEEEPGYRWFAQPYLPARTGSFIAGAFKLKPHPTVVQRMQVEEADLTWKKEGLPADTSYRNSFGPLTTVMMLDPWQKPTTAAPLVTRLGLGGNTFTVDHSDTGSAVQLNLPTQLLLNGNNTVSVLNQIGGPINPTNWKTTLDVTYGTFTGSFELKDGATKRTVPFSGVLRQPADAMDSLIGDGHYLLPALPGAPTNEKTSGEVLFQR